MADSDLWARGLTDSGGAHDGGLRRPTGGGVRGRGGL